jgi:hypothetical protein
VVIALVANTLIINGVYRFGLSRMRRPGTTSRVPCWPPSSCKWCRGFRYGTSVGSSSASVTNGVIGFVLGLIAFLYLVAVIFVLCAEVNVVRVRRLFPRALLTPFTDNVDLTDADRAAYAAQARSMRTKGFERIDARFERDSGG